MHAEKTFYLSQFFKLIFLIDYGIIIVSRNWHLI